MHRHRLSYIVQEFQELATFSTLVPCHLFCLNLVREKSLLSNSGVLPFTAYTAGSAKHFQAAACDASSFLHVVCLYMVHLNPDKI